MHDEEEEEEEDDDDDDEDDGVLTVTASQLISIWQELSLIHI